MRQDFFREQRLYKGAAVEAELFNVTSRSKRNYNIWHAEDGQYIVIEYVPFMGGDAENGPCTEYNSKLVMEGVGGPSSQEYSEEMIARFEDRERQEEEEALVRQKAKTNVDHSTLRNPAYDGPMGIFEGYGEDEEEEA